MSLIWFIEFLPFLKMWLIMVRQLLKTKCQIVTFWWFIIAQNFTIPNLITWAKLIETSVVKIKNSMNEANNITMSCCVNVCLSVCIPWHIYQDCIYEQLHKCGCLLSSETFYHAEQLVRTGLSQSQPGLCEMVALHDLCWDLLFSCQMICKWYIVLTDVLYLELISNPLHLKKRSHTHFKPSILMIGMAILLLGLSIYF